MNYLPNTRRKIHALLKPEIVNTFQPYMPMTCGIEAGGYTGNITDENGNQFILITI